MADRSGGLGGLGASGKKLQKMDSGTISLSNFAQKLNDTDIGPDEVKDDDSAILSPSPERTHPLGQAEEPLPPYASTTRFESSDYESIKYVSKTTAERPKHQQPNFNPAKMQIPVVASKTMQKKEKEAEWKRKYEQTFQQAQDGGPTACNSRAFSFWPFKKKKKKQAIWKDKEQRKQWMKNVLDAQGEEVFDPEWNNGHAHAEYEQPKHGFARSTLASSLSFFPRLSLAFRGKRQSSVVTRQSNVSLLAPPEPSGLIVVDDYSQAPQPPQKALRQ